MRHDTNRRHYEPSWNAFGDDAPRGMEIALLDTVNTVDVGKADPARATERWRDALARIDAAELRIVRRLARLSRFRLLRSITLAVNLLGDGWIYAPLAVALLLSDMPRARMVVLTAMLGTLVAHALYALIKRGVARRRPFEKDAALVPLARVLDRYSFPSGHCMTMTAVLTPVVHGMPACWPVAGGALSMLAWCRLASAHHYPSDVIAGIGLGAVVAMPLSAWLLPG